MAREHPLSPIEHIALRGIKAREDLLRPLIDEFERDQATLLAAVADRLDLPPELFGSSLQIDFGRGVVIDRREEYSDADADHPAYDRP